MPILISSGRSLLIVLWLAIASFVPASAGAADRITPVQEVLRDKENPRFIVTNLPAEIQDRGQRETGQEGRVLLHLG